jgi:tetratricopeptide (TPR) repeat protein/predicted Ser/Thr protein kinase
MIGQTVGHYKVMDKIGEGGMGAVYKAEDTILHRLVALKTLSSHLAEDEEARKRFVREAEATSSLNHPNITTIYELLEDEGKHHICMEYVEGKTIRDIIESGHVSIRKAVDIILQAAEAIQAAHAKGILHRDIKSSNIMVSMEGRVKVMDFGLAHLEERSQLTRTGTTMGTLAYSSPEQLTGRDIDKRSEIWSLGVVFYELLTGQMPFISSSEGELVFAIVTNEQDMPSAIRDDVPESVSSIITKMLIKKPELRYQNCGELIGDLSAVRNELETTTVEISTAAPALKAKRKKQLAIGLGSVVVVIGAIAVLSVSEGTELDRSRVAVDTFENRTGDETLDEIGSWAASHVGDSLLRVTGINTLPAPEAQFAAKTARNELIAGRANNPIEALADETGAGVVVSGEYYLDGESLVFRIHVTDAVSGRPIGALEPVVGDPGSPGECIERLPGQILPLLASHFDDRLVEQSSSIGHASSLLAWLAFKEGLDHYIGGDGRPYGRESNAAAIVDFYRASQLDSAYALPLIYAGICLHNLAFTYMVTERTSERDSISAVLVNRRNELSEYERCWCDWLAESVEARPGFNERKYLLMKRAAEIAPGSKAVYNYAVQAYRTNRPREAIVALESLDPERGPMRGFGSYFSWKMVTHHVLEEFEKELELVHKYREMYPDDPTVFRLEQVRALAAMGDILGLEEYLDECLKMSPTLLWTPADMMRRAASELMGHGHGTEKARELLNQAIQWYENEPGRTTPRKGRLASAFYQLGEWQRAQTLYEELVVDYPEIAGYQGSLGTLAARRGDREEALRISSLLENAEFSTVQNRTYWRACIASLLNEKAEAVKLLEEAFNLGIEPIRAHVDMDLRPLHDYGPFQQLTRQKGDPQAARQMLRGGGLP